MSVLARWESRGGAHYAELCKSTTGYSYSHTNGGGSLGAIATDDGAIAVMQARVTIGLYLPDSAKTPMKRVI